MDIWLFGSWGLAMAFVSGFLVSLRWRCVITLRIRLSVGFYSIIGCLWFVSMSPVEDINMIIPIPIHVADVCGFAACYVSLQARTKTSALDIP